MSDIDSEWKPKARPQSTMAKSLAAALDSAFMLDSEVDELATSISFKQQQVNIQNRELQELEARIRAAEGRLQQSDGSFKTNNNNQFPAQGSANASSSAPTANNNNRESENRHNNTFNRQENPEGDQNGKRGWS